MSKEVQVAEMAETKGDTQAFDSYSKAVALQPGGADAKLGLGLGKVLTEIDQPDKAWSFLESSGRLEPMNATVQARLATLYRKMGHVDDAKRKVELYQKYCPSSRMRSERTKNPKRSGTVRSEAGAMNEIGWE